MRVTTWLLMLCLLLGAGRDGALGAPAAKDADMGSAAPRGCWSLSDGCVGRTGWAQTASIRGPVAAAWSWTVPADPGGVIEEEPRVWLDEVYVCLRVDTFHAALCVLDLSTGRALLPPLMFASAQPLDPCVTEQGVFVRPSEEPLQLVRHVAGRWIQPWQGGVAGAGVRSHLASAGRVHALTAAGIQTWVLPGAQPVWTHEGSFEGRLALCDGTLRALSYDEAGNASLVSWSASTGARGPEIHLGHHGRQGERLLGLGSSIASRGLETFVQHALPIRAHDGTGLRTSHASISSTGTLHDLAALPVAAPNGWLTYATLDGVAALRRCEAEDGIGDLRFWELASSKDRPEFYQPTVPITVAGSVAWVGGRAFDTLSRRVVCRLPEPAMSFRPIPAEGCLLSVPEPRRLVAWRSVAAPPDGPFHLGALRGSASEAAAAAPLVGVQGRILFADATTFLGTFDVDATAGTLLLKPTKGKPSQRALAEAHVILQGEDRLLFASSLRWLERRLERLGRLAARDVVVAALKPAAASRDADLIEQTVLEALVRGATDKELSAARRQAQALRERPLSAYAPKVAETRALLASASGPTPAQIVGILASALDDPRSAVRVPALRRILDLDPQHARAVELVRSALPAHVVVREPFVARDWIDVGDTLAAIPTVKVDPPAEGARPLTPGERELGAARAYWRPDLVGLESAQLLVMTPLQAPGRLSDCLGLGELVCTALEDMCAKGEHVRKQRWPLILQLFATEEEYRKHKQGAGEPAEIQAWSAGHYDPEAGLSRIYVPAGDQDLGEVRRVYAHELTHHWRDQRCPLYEARQAKSSANDVVWIVEGMAELVESFEWNVPARTWATFVPGAQVLDLAAHGPGVEDWNAFFDITYPQYLRIDRTPRDEVVLHSELGATLKLSAMARFYALSGTVCSYLFHAGPQQREALLAYVRDAYTGKVRAGTAHIRERFGMSPAELGAAALAWARKVVRGEIGAGDVYLR